jgi:hypothetical protein
VMMALSISSGDSGSQLTDLPTVTTEQSEGVS